MKPCLTLIALFVLLAVFAAEGTAAPTAFTAPPVPVLWPEDYDNELYLGQKTRRRTGGGRVWSNIYYGDSTLKPNGSGKLNPNFYGLQLGFDLAQGGGVHTTCFLNINQSKTKFSGGNSTIDNYMLGYGKFLYLGMCHFALTGSAGYDRYEIVNDSTATGNGLQTNIFGEFGLDFNLGRWAIKPFYAIQYDFLYHGTVGGQNDWNGHGLQHLFGLRLNWAAPHSLELQSRAVWVHEFLSNPPPFYHTRFSPVHGINTPAIMFYEGNTGRDWIWLGFGIKFECAFNAYLFCDYDALLNERHITHLASLGLLLGW